MGSRKQPEVQQAQPAPQTEEDILYKKTYDDYKAANEKYYVGRTRNAEEEAQFENNARAVAENTVDAFLAEKNKPTSTAPTESEKRTKAIQGDESAADIAARERSTLANPRKQRARGRRSLVSSTSLGSGVNPTRETLG